MTNPTKKPFSERALTTSKSRTGKNGRKTARHRGALPKLAATHRFKDPIGDQSCPEAAYHAITSPFSDNNGHPITKARFNALLNDGTGV